MLLNIYFRIDSPILIGFIYIRWHGDLIVLGNNSKSKECKDWRITYQHHISEEQRHISEEKRMKWKTKGPKQSVKLGSACRPCLKFSAKMTCTVFIQTYLMSSYSIAILLNLLAHDIEILQCKYK